jgi:hypothetical protein
MRRFPPETIDTSMIEIWCPHQEMIPHKTPIPHKEAVPHQGIFPHQVVIPQDTATSFTTTTQARKQQKVANQSIVIALVCR